MAGDIENPQINSQNATFKIDDAQMQTTQQSTPPISTEANMIEQPKSRFSFFKNKIVLILTLLLLIVGLASGGIFLYLNQKVTTYTLISDDTQFYLGLSVKKHPQVQKLLDLSKKLPGGEKMVKYIDENRAEIFGTRKDPFKDILNLAGTEVFLAKISPDETGSERFAVNTLEKLVNIVEFKDSEENQARFRDLENNPNIITTKEAYGSAQIANFQLKSQQPEERFETFSTGPLPYQVTLPLSKSIFAATLDKFLIAAEKENDIKKIVDLVKKDKEKKLKNIKTDKEHNEIVSHFPKEYLLKFYQRQVLDPFANLIPATSLPQTFLFGQSYDTRERRTVGNNVFTTKRGLTAQVFDNGIDFTSYQLTKKSKFQQGLKHGFTIESSLANRLPAVFNSNQPLFYAEARNIKESIQDQIDQLEDVAKNSSDPDQKKAFERAIEDITELKKEVGEVFGVSIDEDLLSWMDNNAAVIVAPGFGGKPPEILFVFEIDDQKAVDAKLAKIKIKDIYGQSGERTKQARDSARKSDVGQLATALQAYFTTPGNGFYPPNLNALVTAGDLKVIPKDPTGADYGYLRCDNGTEATVFIKLEETEKYWAWSSVSGRAGHIENTPATCDFYPSSQKPKPQEEEKVRLVPQTENYNSATIYSNLIYEYEGDQWALRYAAGEDLAIVTVATSNQSIHEILDFKKSSANTLAKEPDWQEQFARAPKNIGGVIYIVSENLMGLVDYYLTKEEGYQDYVQEDWLVILRGYLKALKSIGTTTTQEGKTVISNTFVNIEQIDPEEAKIVEEALDRVFYETGAVGNRTLQSRDSAIKSDVGQIATALQAYYTSPGRGVYPSSLNDLVSSGDLRTIPKTPSGQDYEYLRCDGGREVAVFAKLESTGTYWVWSSVSGRAGDTGQTNPPTSCTVSLVDPQKLAQDNLTKEEISTIGKALVLYKADYPSYPNSLNELAPVYIKAVPLNYDGSSYGYLRCANGQEAVLYVKLQTTGTYWVWSSVSGKAIDTKSSTPPSNTCIYGL